MNILAVGDIVGKNRCRQIKTRATKYCKRK